MGKATIDYKRQQGLTIEQRNAIDLLVQGKTDQETADTVGVNRVTVTKWRNYDPYFQAELNRRRQDVWGSFVDRLRALVPKALETLERELDLDRRPWQVAVQILRLAGLERVGEPEGLTDGDCVLDDTARKKRPDILRDMASGGPVTDTERRAVLDELERQLTEI